MSGDGAGKKRIAIISVSSLLLVAMVVAVAVGLTSNQSKPVDNGGGGGGISSTTGDQMSTSTSKKAIEALCQGTHYKNTCESSLEKAAPNTTDPKELIRAGFKVAVKTLNEAVKNSTTLKELAKDPSTKGALEVCEQVLHSAMEDLAASYYKIGPLDLTKVEDYVEDVKVWLSGAVSHQATCVDAFQNTTGDAGEKMKKFLNTAQELTSNGLAMVTEVSELLSTFNVNTHRRLLGASPGGGKNSNNKSKTSGPRKYHGLPSWMGARKLDLLTATPKSIKPNAVVAKDGSGKYKTITDALKQVPKKSNQTFIIYVKEGVYKEYVTIDKMMTNVFMIGDGPTKTRITGNKNFADGVKTMQTATVAVVGDYFVGKGIGFENSAGAAKHQAVALRVQSDFSIFYNCHMDGYQDTLYTQTYRQYYRNCTITGTIDFIFGDALALFQNCKFVVRKPLENQACMVTAQGRQDKNEVTAIVLQNCTISGDADYVAVKDKNKAYLGRPWKNFSRTIVMQSQIDDIIQPEGWNKWDGENFHQTCFFGEYKNRGPGSDSSKRVKWASIKRLTGDQAQFFTASKWFEGDKWVKPSGVPYASGIMSV